MKKLLLTVTVALACIAGFAQGKVRFQNDTLHLVFLNTDSSLLLPADAGAAGAAIPYTGILPSGVQLDVDLWAGTSSSSLTLQMTTTFAFGPGTPGIWGPGMVTLQGVPAGTNFFQVQIYDQRAGTYAGALALGMYEGESSVFTCVASSGIVYNPLALSTAPSFSTWEAGTQPVTESVPDGMGAISIQAIIPEPTSLTLAGLGAVGVLSFRRLLRTEPISAALVKANGTSWA